MGNQASKDTGDQVAFPGGQTLKKDLPKGVVSQVCYGDGKGGKIRRFGQGLNEPNDAVLSLLGHRVCLVHPFEGGSNYRHGDHVGLPADCFFTFPPERPR